MARTTLNIDTPVLEELKRIQKVENKALGQLVSEVLTDGLIARERKGSTKRRFSWLSRPMSARVDLSDKEALYARLDKRRGK